MVRIISDRPRSMKEKSLVALFLVGICYTGGVFGQPATGVKCRVLSVGMGQSECAISMVDWLFSDDLELVHPNTYIEKSGGYNTIDAGAWYWEAGPNRGLPHLGSTINLHADEGVNEQIVE